MPLHASYILQLLNIRCFAPLKQVYKKEIRGLVDSYINYVNKKAFLVMFLEVYNRAILKSNILSSFRATSLVLLDLEVVLLKLKVKPCTLTLLALGPTTWQLKTLSNAIEIDS
jgi:hypothetical protein